MERGDGARKKTGLQCGSGRSLLMTGVKAGIIIGSIAGLFSKLKRQRSCNFPDPSPEESSIVPDAGQSAPIPEESLIVPDAVQSAKVFQNRDHFDRFQNLSAGRERRPPQGLDSLALYSNYLEFAEGDGVCDYTDPPVKKQPIDVSKIICRVMVVMIVASYAAIFLKIFCRA